jgi:hypothetical protein
VYDKQSSQEAIALLGEPKPRLLQESGRIGLSDERTASVARDLWSIALRGCTHLGATVISREDLDVACEFAARYTGDARSPADEAISHSNPAFAAVTA